MQIPVLSFHSTQLHHRVLHSVQKSISFKHHQFQWQTQSSPERAMHTCTEREGTVTTSCLHHTEVLETGRIWRAVVGKASSSIDDVTFNKHIRYCKLLSFCIQGRPCIHCRCRSTNQNVYFFTHVFANVLNFGSKWSKNSNPSSSCRSLQQPTEPAMEPLPS